MKKNILFYILSLILCIIMLASNILAVFAEDNASADTRSGNIVDVDQTPKAQETVTAVKDVKTELICISKYGDILRFPANSAEGVLSAAEQGADMVLVRAEKTADGQIVLLSEPNLSNICVDKDGKKVNKNVSQVNYDELKAYFLCNSSGLPSEKKSAYSVPTLQHTLELVDKRTVLLIDNGWEWRNEIYDILSNAGALEYTALITDAGKSEILKWEQSKGQSPLIVTKYSGTVVWNSRAYIRKSVAAQAIGVLLENNNAYSTTFSKSTVAKTKGQIRAAIDMTDPKLCGNRQDTAVYWDDVTGRGFSMIITNNIDSFIDYRLRVEQSRRKLDELLKTAQEVDFTLLSASSSSKLKKASEEAEKVLNSSVSAIEIENEYNRLFAEYGSIREKGSDSSKAATYTKGRITAAVLVTVLLIIAEFAFEYFRNKSIALRKNGKKLFFNSKRKKKKKSRKINFE